MRKFFLLLVIVFGLFNKSIAQVSGMSFEVHYPLIFSNEYNLYSDNSGVLGGNFQYQFTENIPFNFGLEYKFDLIQTIEILNEYSDPTKRNFLISNIDIYSKMLFITVPELQLYTSIGFTTYKYRASGIGKSHIGFNTGAGLSYDIYDKIYLFTSYSYIQASFTQNNGYTLDPDKHHLIRIGAGFKL